MAVFVHYCDQCGIRIEPEDIEEGRALVSSDKAYCPACAEKVKATQQKPAQTEEPVSARKPAPRATPRGIKRKTTTSLKRRPRREKRVDEYEQESREREPATILPQKKSPLPLVLGVAGVLVVIVVIIAVSSGGGGKPVNTEHDEFSRLPGDTHGGYQPDPVEPVEPQYQEQPPSSAALKRYEEAFRYAENNPENYAKVVEKFESILQEETVPFALSTRIQVTISEWMSRWMEAAAREKEKTAKAAKELVAKDDHEGAAKLWENFPEKYKKLGSYGEDCQAEAARLRKEKDALAALKELEGDIKAAEKKFTVDEIEQLEKLLEKLCAFGRKYEEIDLVVEKLEPAVTKLREELGALEEEKWAKEFEEFNKQQEEERKKAAEQRWAALKTHWQTFYQQYDQNAGTVGIGTYTLFDGRSTTGWTLLTGRDPNVTWQVQTGAIAGRNNGTKGCVLAPRYKQAYFWEDYTFSVSIRVIAGSCSVAVRANVDQQKRLSGTTFQVPGGGGWVKMKIEVKGDAASATADGKQAGAMNTNYPTGYPAFFLQPNSQVEFKDAILELKTTRK